MKLIVGLGNPGKKYDKTRHNVGFEVLDTLARRFGDGSAKAKFAGQVMEATIEGQRALLLWPHTLMNGSGTSVSQAALFYKLDLEDLLVICDDFHLPLGKIRFRGQGSAGGQKGLEDILGRLGSGEFSRLRIGIGPVPEHWNAADFVLSRYGKKDREAIEEEIARAAEGVGCWITQGIHKSMNQFN